MTHKYRAGFSADALNEVVHADDIWRAAEYWVNRHMLNGELDDFLDQRRDVFIERDGELNRIAVSVRMKPAIIIDQIVTLTIDGVPTGVV